MTADWKKFEEAVAAFLQAADPRAKVLHNVKLPDIHTRTPRQRDVWIETTYGGHIPISILVSCKRLSSKLDQQDIDAFVGELRSSTAHLGVLYSYSGYTEPAIAKAAAIGIACCTLYEDRAPDIPEVLFFSAFCNTEAFRLSMTGDPGNALQTMNDIFDIPVSTPNGIKSALEVLAQEYESNRGIALSNLDPANLPTWSSEIEIEHHHLPRPIKLGLLSQWKRYQARMESWLVNGSYSFSNRNFKGSIATPAIDRLGPHPGPGWKPVEMDQPLVQTNVISCFLHGGDLVGRLRESLGARSPAMIFSRAQ